MTYEEWWGGNKQLLNEQQMTAWEAVALSSASAWNAATAAERQRCREIALNVGEEGFLWFTCANKIADEIGE